jgi:hypothetical protein
MRKGQGRNGHDTTAGRRTGVIALANECRRAPYGRLPESSSDRSEHVAASGGASHPPRSADSNGAASPDNPWIYGYPAR